MKLTIGINSLVLDLSSREGVFLGGVAGGRLVSLADRSGVLCRRRTFGGRGGVDRLGGC
jgi:hypothetical protein